MSAKSFALFANDDKARAVVQPNPDLFDQARPADIQALAIAVPCQDGTCEWHHPLYEKVMNELDWKALAALVK